MDLEQFLGKGGTAVDAWQNAWYLLDNSQLIDPVEQGTAGAQASVNARNRDFDGSDFYSATEVDDETGVTSHRLATVAAGARYLGVAVDWSPYATASGNRTHRIVFGDGTKKAWGYIGEADAAEAKASAKTLTAITKINPGVVSCVGHGYSIGDVVYFSGLTEMTSLNTKYKTITASADADHFTIHDTSAETAAETTGGACVQKLTALGTTAVKLYSTPSGATQSLTGNGGINANAITSCEVYKVLGAFTGDQVHSIVVKPDDGQPAAAEKIWSISSGAAGTKGMEVLIDTNGTIQISTTEDGTNLETITSDAAVFANGAQTDFTSLGLTIDKTTGTGAINVNGSDVASTETITTGAIFDAYAPVTLGATGGAGYLNGQIARHITFAGTLPSANDLYWSHHRNKLRYV